MSEYERDRDVVAMLRRWAVILRDVKPDKAAQAEKNANDIERMINDDD